TAAAMTQLAEVLQIYGDRFDAGGVDVEVRPKHQAIRATLGQAEQALAEAERETLPNARSPEASEGLVRSLRRLASDAIMIGRALAEPLPSGPREHIGPQAIALLIAIAERMGSLAAAREAGKAAPPDSLSE